MTTLKTVLSKLATKPTSDGDGVRIERIGAFNKPQLSPFLMLDELKSDEKADYIGGFPLHPHRGIETLTYMKTGHFQHKDHLGNVGEISSGGAQWMATGRGILHSEMPIMEDGELHCFQIWINQPARLKMSQAQYANLEAGGHTRIPSKREEGELVLIAGHLNYGGEKYAGPLQDNGVPVVFADWFTNSAGSIEITIEPSLTCHIYVYKGSVKIGNALVNRGELATLGDEDILQLATQQPAGVLILAGQSIQEPVSHYGPFVMNTREEIEQTIADYQSGKFATYL